MNSTTRNLPGHAFAYAELLVIIGIIAVLAVMLVYVHVHSKPKRPLQAEAQEIHCVNNLKQIGLAFRVWEGDQDNKYPMGVSTNRGGSREFDTGADTFRHFQVMSNELATPKILVCPADTRVAAADFVHLNNQNVSYFVGLVATDVDPQRFLDGDRNISADNEPENGILKLVPGQRVSWTETMHVHQGNIGLSDGSVQETTDRILTELLKASGDPTNTWRISLPE